MKRVFYKFLVFIFISIYLHSCTSYTREEIDVYTITERDTTYSHFSNNSPGNSDGGTINPSNRDIIHERVMVQIDSTVKREYPDWIRYGLFESIGIIGGDSDFSLGNGMFGIHPNLFSLLDQTNRGSSGNIFSGGIYRFGILEDRLRWFQDAENWTLGFNALEIIAPSAKFENTLIGFATPYVRKRWYFRDKIPYMSVTASLGLSPWGFISSNFSGYLNASVSFDIGSIGGLNFRTYLGYIYGQNPKNTIQIKQNEFINQEVKDNGSNLSLPYFGLGISFADFVNIVPELYTEYKDMDQSAWNIGLLQFSILYTSADNSFFDAVNLFNLRNKMTIAVNDGDISEIETIQQNIDDINNKLSIVKGMYFRLLPVSLALPIFEDYKFYAGTSLITGMLLGSTEAGFGFLPIRAGWWHTLLKDELTLEPFMEYLYYPSSVFNMGARINLRMFEEYNFGLMAGYTIGDMFSSTDIKMPGLDLGIFEDFGKFSVFYIGLSIGIKDRIFFPQDLRYNN